MHPLVTLHCNHRLQSSIRIVNYPIQPSMDVRISLCLFVSRACACVCVCVSVQVPQEVGEATGEGEHKLESVFEELLHRFHAKLPHLHSP